MVLQRSLSEHNLGVLLESAIRLQCTALKWFCCCCKKSASERASENTYAVICAAIVKQKAHVKHNHMHVCSETCPSVLIASYSKESLQSSAALAQSSLGTRNYQNSSPSSAEPHSSDWRRGSPNLAWLDFEIPHYHQKGTIKSKIPTISCCL